MQTYVIVIIVSATLLAIVCLVAFGLSIYAATKTSVSSDQVVVVSSSLGETIYSLVHRATISVYVSLGSTFREGSGFLWKVDSLNRVIAVTAAHVVQDASFIEIVITNSSNQTLQVQCTILGIDKAADIALIVSEQGEHSFSDTSLDLLEWAPEGTYAIGQTVFAVGNPQGQDFASVANGVIRDNKYVPTQDSGVIESIYTSIATTSGNSGGPIINSQAKVCGLSNWVAVDPNTDVALNSFSGGLNAFMASQICERLLQQTHARGYLGLVNISIVAGLKLLTLRANYPNFVSSNLDVVRGVSIDELDTENIIVPGSRCSNAGLQVDDIILAINQTNIGVFQNEFSPTRVTWFTSPGTTVKLTIVRPSSGQLMQFDVILDEFPTAHDVPLTTYC